MGSNHHDLVHEFPEYRDLIHQLKTKDAHFRRLFDRYHELDHMVHGSEQRVRLMSELDEEKLRKERLVIKDELYIMLVKAKNLVCK